MCGIQKKANLIQRFGYCLLQEVTISHLKFLFTFYTKSLRVVFTTLLLVCFISLEEITCEKRENVF